MARVQYAPEIIEINGKIGGTIFRHTWCGDIASGNGRQVDKKTPAQLEVRAAFSHCIGYWKNFLDFVDRAYWAAEATHEPITNSKGEVVHLSPYCYYLHVNIPRSLSGLDPLYRPE